jgi:hypothetical protein
MYLTLMPTKQHGVTGASELLQIVWKPRDTPLTSESHVVKEEISIKQTLFAPIAVSSNKSINMYFLDHGPSVHMYHWPT